MGSSPSWDKDHGRALEVSSALPRIGQRVVLRRLSTADLAHFQAYRQDEEVSRYQGWTSEPDHQALTFLEEMSSAPLFAPATYTGRLEGKTGQLTGQQVWHFQGKPIHTRPCSITVRLAE